MRHTKHQIHKGTRASAGDFAPYFDWDETEPPSVAPLPDVSLTELIAEVCERWMRQGGLIVRYHFGVKTIAHRRSDGKWIIPPIYKTQKYCCPLAPLLDGQPSNFMPIADAANLLQVDQYFVVGFMHGVDQTTKSIVGRRMDIFDESPNYFEGRAIGLEIAERYITIPGGWEV